MTFILKEVASYLHVFVENREVRLLLEMSPTVRCR